MAIDIRLVEKFLVALLVMDEKELSHQQSLVTDSFSTIERLENEMATITREFESLDSNEVTESEPQSLNQDESMQSTEIKND